MMDGRETQVSTQWPTPIFAEELRRELIESLAHVAPGSAKERRAAWKPLADRVCAAARASGQPQEQMIVELKRIMELVPISGRREVMRDFFAEFITLCLDG